MRTTVQVLITSGLLLSGGMLQAATNNQPGVEDKLPATWHQEEALNLNSGPDYHPMYQFKRRGADYAAVMPATYHQADVLNLHRVSSNSEGKRQQHS